MKALKRPLVLTYCNNYVGRNNSIWSELYHNRSDFSPNLGEVHYAYYEKIKYSPAFYFANAITILSGRIFDTLGSRISILSSFTIQIWLLFYAILLLIAIIDSIKNQDYWKWTFDKVGVAGQFVKLWAATINQSNQFGNICCVKHLILNSVTIISIFVMTLFFNSEVLSILLFHPLVKIETLDNLVEFVKQHDDVKLITGKVTSSWAIMKSWQDERAKFLLPRMATVPIYEFDYKQVYHGKSIIISFDYAFEHMMKSNPDHNFHMSADRLFSLQYGLIYSKYIDSKIKHLIDSIMTSLFESGIYNFNEEKKFSKHLDLEEEETPMAISLSYFKKIIYSYTRLIILLLLSLIAEILHFLYQTKKTEIKKLLLFLQNVPEKIIRLCRWHEILLFLYKIKRTDIRERLLSLQNFPKIFIWLCRWRSLCASLIHLQSALLQLFQKKRKTRTINVNKK